jgi:hypothetical protein
MSPIVHAAWLVGAVIVLGLIFILTLRPGSRETIEPFGQIPFKDDDAPQEHDRGDA